MEKILQMRKTPMDQEGGGNPEWNHTMGSDLELESLLDQGKEYSKADSRYAARDAVGVTLEGLVVFLGGLCLIALYATGPGKSYRYLLQFVISLGHLYGSAVYVITSLLEGDDFAIIPYYYYGYYMLSNLCWKNTCAAFLQLQSQNKVKSH